MSSIDLQHLVQRMSVPVRASLEGAAALAVRHSHDAIELHHWLGAMALDATFRELLERVGVSSNNFANEINREINTLPRGTGGTPAFSGNVISLAREGWVATSLGSGRTSIAFADLLAVLADDASLRSLSRAISPSLRGLDAARLEAERAQAVEPVAAAPRPGNARPGVGAASGEDFLALYTQDMTADAMAGRVDPVVGREDELRQVIDILLRRRQNNPILVGEAGVGKTAVAEAFALKLAAGEVPESLRGTRLLSLDLSLLQAGAGVKGEFERRLTGVVDAVKASPEPVILFIDEAHGLVGAGNQPGQGDAAHILKPALARGELRTIAATTWGEYKRYIERDAALTRRFQPVKVGEPDEETAVRMLRGVVDILQSHHGVRIRDEALRAAVRLSARYIPARQLPDKAVSLIDTAAASVAFGRAGEPARLEDARREHEHLVLEGERLAREPGDEATAERQATIRARLPELETQISELEARLATERELVSEADRIETEIEQDDATARTSFRAAAGRLAEVQGDDALIHRVVDAEAVASVVARWTGVPLGRLVSDQLAAVNELGARLKARIVGQDDALDRLAAAMRVARARLSDPRRPTGVFLMVGMSGVGKTETALALADILYGGPQSLTTINMSEFKEEHKVSMLLGSPPGYVGYGEGGVLTEAVRRRPYGVLLLDEIDKAHPGVQDVFYQLFDKGTIRDGEGRDIDFRNTLILLTANTGSEVLQALSADPETMPEGDALTAVLKDALLTQFKPAFLGRTVVLPYRPLGKDALTGIVDLQIERVADRLRANYGAELTLTPAARTVLVSTASAGDTGARAIESTIARDLLPVLSSFFLDATIAGRKPRDVSIDHRDGAFTVASRPLAAQAVDLAPPSKPARQRRREAV
ncbi:type VI secretion system ATPase TssH [Aureimonas jatrophae]|uniref:Type VI secretion system protein VasG n=1 Tax=Aureimonas jatrophae TaxID=1166073 RepID=A0A1H0N475_9HYPH|nr:type VI secretion system ATPase TssH [Aureimonas jatrophae]MBB3953029.1 type VI secretion system protein VasG [Aureimonas jatrophae]SDO87463.1 type VI secretion system protein VasG [Aureimonas jatrophae]